MIVLGTLPRAQMAMKLEYNMVTKEQGSSVVGGSNNRHKSKAAHYAFNWESLENPDMQVEMD